MSIAKSNFTIISDNPLGLGGRLVTGRFYGPTSYASGGEALTVSLSNDAFGGSMKDIIFSNGVRNSDGAQLQASWNPSGAVAGTSLGDITICNAVAPHSHAIVTSGGVTLAANDHLGIVSSQLSQPGSTATVQAGGATGVQNNAATAAATELTNGTNCSAFIFPFVAVVS